MLTKLAREFTNAEIAHYLHQDDQIFHIENWDKNGEIWGEVEPFPVCL